MSNFTGWIHPEHIDSTEINGITRFVVCAANKYGDHVVLGVRHSCPIMNSTLQKSPDLSKQERKRMMNESDDDLNFITCQGFIDQWGNWMSRETAFKLVNATGQYIDWERNGSTKTLYSEGLYSIQPYTVKL